MFILMDMTPFSDPDFTAKGEPRARVRFRGLETLWLNTGTLCNLACAHCYIESSPTNDRLAYLKLADVRQFLNEARERGEPLTSIGITGGEPFMNPEIDAIIEECLGAALDVLVLTNAMTPMTHHRAALVRLGALYPGRLSIRVSLDHFDRVRHEQERGPKSWQPSIDGLKWLSANGFSIAVAGRTLWNDDEKPLRAGYAQLFGTDAIAIDAHDPAQLVLFPEMDEAADVPEITTACWQILHKDPQSLMCANERMLVRRKGAAHATLTPCTLIPYDLRFDMGGTIAEASRDVPLNHRHCAKFCVLGGGSCG
jgi:uncharacterized Fe-S cluster-containing radical SAM superfamily protein